MKIYFVPFHADAPQDIILYDLSDKEEETLAFSPMGQVSFEYKKVFYQLPGGRWAYTVKEAMEIIKFYLLEDIKDLEEKLRSIDEALNLI